MKDDLPVTVCRRAQLAEQAFLELAEILGSAPDPTPLLTSAGTLKASIDGMLHAYQLTLLVGLLLTLTDSNAGV